MLTVNKLVRLIKELTTKHKCPISVLYQMFIWDKKTFVIRYQMFISDFLDICYYTMYIKRLVEDFWSVGVYLICDHRVCNNLCLYDCLWPFTIRYISFIWSYLTIWCQVSSIHIVGCDHLVKYTVYSICNATAWFVTKIPLALKATSLA